MNKFPSNFKVLLVAIILSCSFFAFTGIASAASSALDQVVIFETKDDYNKEEAAAMKERIGRIHPEIIHALYEKSLMIKLINFPLTDLPEHEFLRGEVPRGWEDTGKTWDDVPGAGGNPAVARIGYSNPSEWHGTINLELHELAHLIDSHVYDSISHTKEFTTIHQNEQAGFLPDGYFTNNEEYFAESFSYFYLEGAKKSLLKQQAPKTYEFIMGLPAILSGDEPEEDIDVPVITLQGDNSIELYVGDVYKELGATAKNKTDGDLSRAIKVSGEVNTEKSGNYIVTYSVTDKAGNNSTVTRKVKVLDRKEDLTPPEITLLGDKSMELRVDDLYEELGATAKSNTDRDLSEKIVISGDVNTEIPGSYIVTYSITDNNGNTATANREIKVVEKELYDDRTAPVITINGDSIIELHVGETYEEMGATAEDNVDGDLSKDIKVTGKVTTDKPGKYIITYSVTDEAGNRAKETRTVKVLEPSVDKDTKDNKENNEDDDDEIMLTDTSKNIGEKGLKDNIMNDSALETNKHTNLNSAAPKLPASSSTNTRLLIVIGLLLTVSGSSMLLIRKTT